MRRQLVDDMFWLCRCRSKMQYPKSRNAGKGGTSVMRSWNQDGNKKEIWSINLLVRNTHSFLGCTFLLDPHVETEGRKASARRCSIKKRAKRDALALHAPAALATPAGKATDQKQRDAETTTSPADDGQKHHTHTPQCISSCEIRGDDSKPRSREQEAAGGADQQSVSLAHASHKLPARTKLQPNTQIDLPAAAQQITAAIGC